MKLQIRHHRHNDHWAQRSLLVLLALAACLLPGCSGLRQWWQNGMKVGPNYCEPPAQVAPSWIDQDDPAVRSEAADYSRWWTVFNDPVLNRLVELAGQQNLPLRIAGLRILEARAQRAVAAGNLLPQRQQMRGGFSRNKFSDNMYPFGSFPGNREYDDWVTGFDMDWELDLWGRLRRAVEAADANVEAQIENYHDVLVILQAEVAAAYIQMRTLEQQLRLAQKNVQLQEEALELIEKRFEQGVISEIDVRQARAELAVTRSLIPQLQEAHRKVQNALCLLTGLPPGALQQELSQPGPIPSVPAEVVVGIPADLLRRRPDVRRAERQVAAQCARIGIAEAEFYPRISLAGTISLEAEQFSDLFSWQSIGGGIGPRFEWKILNYGRLAGGVRAEDARFQQAVLAYQNAVLAANKEAEDAIVAFLREQQRAAALDQAVQEVTRALQLGLRLYEQGLIDYQRVLDSQRALVLQEDALAQSRGKVATNLVAVYKALGGGWDAPCESASGAVPSPVPAGPDDGNSGGPASSALQRLPLTPPQAAAQE